MIDRYGEWFWDVKFGAVISKLVSNKLKKIKKKMILMLLLVSLFEYSYWILYMYTHIYNINKGKYLFLRMLLLVCFKNLWTNRLLINFMVALR